MMTDKLVIALSYYNTPFMLREQIRNWQEFPDNMVNKVKIILVDDCSMTHPAEKELRATNVKIPVELYRITKDISQNIFGVRNLAFHIAAVEEVKWVLCLDLDHVLTVKGFEGFEEIKPNLVTSLYYHPARYIKQTSGMLPIGRHLDSFLITPDLYWKTGGYDEDFTGYYYNGASLHFRKVLNRLSKGINIDKMFTVFYPSSVVEDASPMRDQVKKTYQGTIPDSKEPSVLNFEWERVL